MLRNRLFILLLVGACLFTASAAWADDVGFVNCSSHPEDTQVFGKPRKTPDLVASMPCGERFTVLLYGFIFSRIETKDGKVGYVYSSLISVDHSPASVQVASARVPVATSPAARSNVRSTAAVGPSEPTTFSQPRRSQTQSARAQSPEPVAKAPETIPAPMEPNPAPPVQPQATPDQRLALPSTIGAEPRSPQPAAPEPIAKAPQPAPAEAVQPDPTTIAQPETPAQPAAPPVRSANARISWEKPNPDGRRPSMLELFGGYAFARLTSGGTATNLSGALGSFGWNARPWLQIVGDSSYSVVTASGVKNVLYGNHYGPRLFRRGRNRWGATPFAEALFGESRSDTTVTGSGGYTVSQNVFSFKVGGGLDINPSRHFQIRLLDVDYYRTSFGTNVHQNNYWASTGIVIRLFGGGPE